MAEKLTYKELEQRVKKIEGKALRYDQVVKNLLETKTLLNNVLYHSGNDAIVVADMDLCILLYNQKAKAFFGYEKEEVIGKSIWRYTLRKRWNRSVSKRPLN